MKRKNGTEQGGKAGAKETDKKSQRGEKGQKMEGGEMEKKVMKD